MSNKLLNLHTDLLKLTKHPNYQKLYKAVHKNGNQFVINYFDGLVDFLAYNGAVIISTDLAFDKIEDAIGQDDTDTTILKKRKQRILSTSQNNHSIWCVYNPEASLNSNSAKAVAEFLNERVVEPLTNTTGFTVKNIRKAIDFYKKNIDVTKHNDVDYNSFSFSDRLDMNSDTQGFLATDTYVRKLDKIEIKHLKNHKFSSVTDPQVIKEFIG